MFRFCLFHFLGWDWRPRFTTVHFFFLFFFFSPELPDDGPEYKCRVKKQNKKSIVTKTSLHVLTVSLVTRYEIAPQGGASLLPTILCLYILSFKIMLFTSGLTCRKDSNMIKSRCRHIYSSCLLQQ